MLFIIKEDHRWETATLNRAIHDRLLDLVEASTADEIFEMLVQTLRNFVLPLFLTVDLCMVVSKVSLSLTLSHALSLSLSRSFALSLSHSHTLSLSQSLTLSLLARQVAGSGGGIDSRRNIRDAGPEASSIHDQTLFIIRKK